MSRTVTAQEIQQDTDAILASVRSGREPVYVEDDGQSRAVIISVEEYQRLRRIDEAEQERLWAVVESVQQRNADKDPDEVLRDVTEIVEEVRQELYEKWRAESSGR
jgi:PHD/YefM family antitoxin component YafN of YafNO toxin-antitoxin module